MSDTAFAKLKELNIKLGNQACVGIDPDEKNFDNFLKQQLASSGPEDFLKNYASYLIDAAAEKVSSVKIQSAFFEAYGAPGFSALAYTVKYAKEKGLVAILDAKRCDIANTMQAYGRAAFDQFGADMLTVILYMGTGTLEALRPWFDQGKGVHIVLMSSNPEGAQLQNLKILGAAQKSQTLAWELLQQTLQWSDKHGYKDHLGFVVGTTILENLDTNARGTLSKLPLLMPGLGAQGGALDDQLRAMYRSNRSTILPISRGITGATSSFDPMRTGALNSWASFSGLIRDRIKSATKQLG